MRAAAAVLAALLAGCASEPSKPQVAIPGDRVVLLPGAGGASGALVVRQGAGEALLDRAYASARAGGDGALEVGEVDAAAVKSEFGAVLMALPPAAASFVVYFVFGQDELTEESRKTIVPALEDVVRRPAPEITVIGHADQVGPEHVNDALSLKRAERVKALLVQRGVPRERIVTVGRGAREPAVRAVEGTSELRNRRVEISVR